MSSESIVKYKPLIEVVDFHGNKYYSEMTYEEMVRARSTQELIDFSFSGDCVKTSQIVRHRLADPQEVIMAWKTQQLTYWQKEALKCGIKEFQEKFAFTKPLNENIIDRMIENIKAKKMPLTPKPE